eukprot:NODE_11477_length_257_cov_78.841346_g9707_i0.p3 GENE.NODE_11477_length_257_cov_78.841346_g9707_i0~~NODE_11477_length_257_cov_78.841346_g9707_i0.p3  ORF type:complete len:80 (+),score=21.13 NODE_11477_length_257_cov_78.841346_g9707_i0:26-241(+)
MGLGFRDRRRFARSVFTYGVLASFFLPHRALLARQGRGGVGALCGMPCKYFLLSWRLHALENAVAVVCLPV